MIEKVMKAVKRNNKRRSVNITIGAVVGFLLSCTAVMGATIQITGDGNNFTATEIEGNTFENDAYTNNVEVNEGVNINGTSNDKKLFFINNGIINAGSYEAMKIDMNAEIAGKITNNGIISATVNGKEGILILRKITALDGTALENNGTLKSNGIGINIANGATVTGDIVNTGVVNAKVNGINVANGVTVTGKISNDGIMKSETSEGISVSGTLIKTGGTAIENSGTIDANTNGINMLSIADVKKDIVNNGTIKNKGNRSPIVLFGELTGNMINKGKMLTEYTGITMQGTMTGDIINDGSINSDGIEIRSTNMLTGNINNNGRILSETTVDPYGINVKGKITGKIDNQGYLDIKSASGKGIGIQTGKDTSGITNNGNIRVAGGTETKGIVINGTSTLNNGGIINSGNGVGLSIERSGTVNSLMNFGVIYGKTKAIKNEGTLQSPINYGLMINKGNNTTDVIENVSSLKNYGMTISVGDNGTYLIDGKTNHTGPGHLIINAESTIENMKIVGTESVKSSELRDNTSGGFTNHYIINGINDTFKVDKNRIFTNSYVSAYRRAIVMEDGKELTAEDRTVFNGGVDGTSETVYLAGNNTLTLTGTSIINGNTQINGDSNEFTMEGSIQNGDIETSNSGKDNNISLSAGSIMNGEAKIAGTGNTLEITDGSIMNGDITATGNDTKLSLDKSIQNGNMTAEGNNNDVKVSESILNGDVTAKGDNTNLALTKSIQNGNMVAEGTGNELKISDSILNGDTTINGDGNTLAISGENTYLNGDLTSTGNNALNLNGKKANGSSLNMFHEVSGFNEMNIDSGSVTFFEDSTITGTDKVTVAEDATLNLRLEKSTDKDPDNNLNKSTHALLPSVTGNSDFEITGGGTLKFLTNGIGQGVSVDIGSNVHDIIIATNSVLDGYKIDENNKLVLAVYDSLDGLNHSGTLLMSKIFQEEVPGFGKFGDINGIYKGIFSSDKDDKGNLEALKNITHIDRNTGLANEGASEEEQLRNLRAYLNEVYTQSPYALSSELSRKSIGMFREIAADNMFRPNLNQWMIMGGLTHVDGGTKDTYYGEVYEMDGKNSLGTKVDTKLTGAYALGKYGYSENVTLGVTVGGNRSEAELDKSKVKGNSGYIGAFAENYRGNLTLKAGAGVQYSEYDADRATIGGYSYSDKYSDMAYDIYLNGRYSNPVGENLFLEPYVTLSYTYVDQEGTDEGNKALAMKTDSKSFDYTAAKVGLDLKKVIPHEIGKSTLSAGVSYTRLLSGADADSLTGNFGGSDFALMVASKNEHSLGLNAKYALELQSGILFDVKGNYSFERDSHNDNARNKNKGEWIVGAGLGYKF